MCKVDATARTNGLEAGRHLACFRNYKKVNLAGTDQIMEEQQEMLPERLWGQVWGQVL